MNHEKFEQPKQPEPSKSEGETINKAWEDETEEKQQKESLEKISAYIDDAQSFDELFKILDKRGEIWNNSSHSFLSAEGLKNQITQLRDADPEERQTKLAAIPGTEKLRDTVTRLWLKELKEKDIET